MVFILALLQLCQTGVKANAKKCSKQSDCYYNEICLNGKCYWDPPMLPRNKVVVEGILSLLLFGKKPEQDLSDNLE